MRMNIYVCSTVRHLIFSLLAARKKLNEQHQIIYFIDYQNAPLSDWNLESLPSCITVHVAERENFRKQLNSNWRGKLWYFLAMRNASAPRFLRSYFVRVLKLECPLFAVTLEGLNDSHLWLFNERNKMARLFRLLMQRFSLIEEGVGNYIGVKCPWWKWPIRLALGRPISKWYFGEDKRCQAIWLPYPENLPKFVKKKGRRFDFLGPSENREFIQRLFERYSELKLPQNTVILGTSPLNNITGMNKAKKLVLFERIANALENRGANIRIKPHPRENPNDYAIFGNKLLLATAKLPLEAFILAADERLTIVSPYTSAGIGLEEYVYSVQLLSQPSDPQHTAREIDTWLENPKMLSERIQDAMTEAQTK